MSILHIESLEKRGDKDTLTKTIPTAYSMFHGVDFDAEELAN